MEFNKKFCTQEIRCGYTVSADMKKVWSVELLLLEHFMEICKKHSLPFSLSGGSLLGAVRHKGFIPWDDDIDIMMMREDYDKLCKIAPDEFFKPYFFQTHYTDTGYTRAHAQLRHSETAGILRYELGKCPFNQGIFIDIFPLDNLPSSMNSLKKMQNKVFFFRRLLALTCDYAVNSPKTLPKNILHAVATPLINSDRLYSKLEKECRKYNSKKSDFVAPVSSFPKEQKMIFPAEAYDKLLTVRFENLKVPIPAGYDKLLKIQYGDYMTMRRENSYHGGIIFDTEKSYTEYISKPQV